MCLLLPVLIGGSRHISVAAVFSSSSRSIRIQDCFCVLCDDVKAVCASPVLRNGSCAMKYNRDGNIYEND